MPARLQAAFAARLLAELAELREVYAPVLDLPLPVFETCSASTPGWVDQAADEAAAKKRWCNRGMPRRSWRVSHVPGDWTRPVAALLDGIEAEALAGELAAEVVALLRWYVDPSLHAAVAACPRLTAEWPWPWPFPEDGTTRLWWALRALRDCARPVGRDHAPARLSSWELEWITRRRSLDDAKDRELEEYAAILAAESRSRAEAEAFFDAWEAAVRSFGRPLGSATRHDCVALLWLCVREVAPAQEADCPWGAAAWRAAQSLAGTLPGEVPHASAACAEYIIGKTERLDGLEPDAATAALAEELTAVVAGRRGPGLLDWLRAGEVGTDPGRWDARFGEYLARTDGERAERWTAHAAKRHEERAKQLPAPGVPASVAPSWYGWITPDRPAPQFATVLAGALWPGVRDRMLEERARARRNPPATVRAVQGDLLLIVWKGRAELPARDRPTMVDRDTGRTIATVDPAIAALACKAIETLGSVYGHRLIRELVLRGHAQSGDPECDDPRAVQFDGGWKGLAEALGYHGRNANALLRALAQVGLVRWQHPELRGGGLWTWTEKRGGPGAPGYVRFVLGDLLMPGLAAAMRGRERLAREARRLVPELRHEPPVSAANERSAGALWTLHRLFVLALADRAPELVDHGGIRLTAQDWRAMADRAGVPSTVDVAGKVLPSWMAGDGQAPPLLEAKGCDRWTLAKPHAAERDFLREQGSERKKRERERRRNAARKPKG